MFRMEPDLLANHDTDDRLGQIEYAFEIRIDDVVPVFFTHQRDQFVPRDAGVVDENVDSSESLLHLFDETLRLFEVGDVGLKCHDGVAVCDLIRQRLILCIGEYDSAPSRASA